MAGLLGEPFVETGDILLARHADAKAVGQAALAAIRRERCLDGLLLSRVTEGGPLHEALDGIKRTSSLDGSMFQARLRDFATAEAYFGRFKAKARRESRRQRRNLEELGAVAFRITGPGDEARALVKRAIAWKSEWLDQAGIASRVFSDPAALDFLAELAGDERLDCGILVSALTVAGDPCAIEIGFDGNGHYVAYLGAFDPDYAKYGAGGLQMEETVRALFARGAGVYDLLSADGDYKARWATHTVPVADLAIALSGLGWLQIHLWQTRLRPLVKRIHQHCPRSLRRLTAPLIKIGKHARP